MKGASPDDRVSSRRVFSADEVERAGFPILHAEAESLRRQVQRETAGKPVRHRIYYLTYEEVIGEPETRRAA